MRKTFLLILSLISAMTFSADWSGINWLASGNADYANKYKVAAAYGQTVVDIQNPWGSGWGIYTSFPAAIVSCTGLAEGKYKIVGAGVLLYVTAFTQKETELTVEAGGVSYDFTVFYADGTGDVQTDPEPEKPGSGNEGQATSATYKSTSEAEIAGAKVQFDWTIVYNPDKTLTFEISWNQDISGVVPQICIDDKYTTMPFEGKKARFTTKETYNAGDALKAFFYIAYTGNAARIDITGYKIGDANVTPSEPSGQENPGGQDGQGETQDPDSNQQEPGQSGEDDAKGLEDAQTDKVQGTKVMENGVLYIEKNGVRFNVSGARIKF